VVTRIGTAVLSFAMEDLGKHFGHGPFPDPLHAVKEIGMGDPVAQDGRLEDTDLFFMAINILKRHGALIALSLKNSISNRTLVHV